MNFLAFLLSPWVLRETITQQPFAPRLPLHASLRSSVPPSLPRPTHSAPSWTWPSPSPTKKKPNKQPNPILWLLLWLWQERVMGRLTSQRSKYLQWTPHWPKTFTSRKLLKPYQQFPVADNTLSSLFTEEKNEAQRGCAWGHRAVSESWDLKPYGSSFRDQALIPHAILSWYIE